MLFPYANALKAFTSSDLLNTAFLSTQSFLARWPSAVPVAYQPEAALPLLYSALYTSRVSQSLPQQEPRVSSSLRA